MSETMPYLVHFKRPGAQEEVWIRPDDVSAVEPGRDLEDDSLVLVFLRSGRAYSVKPPRGDDFTTDPVEAVCRRLAGLPLCDGSHEAKRPREINLHQAPNLDDQEAPRA